MEMSSVATTSSLASTYLTPSSRCLERAKELASEAVEQDLLKNYKVAATCYREAISLFRRVLGQQHKQHLEKHPKLKVGVKEKILLCSERLRILDRYLLEQSDLCPLLENVVWSQVKKGDGREDEVLAPVVEEVEKTETKMKEYVGSNISIKGSTHSLYPKCEIKRTTSILSEASDFGLGEEIEERKTEDATPPLADLRNELRISLSSLYSDEGSTSTMKRKKLPESDADAIIVLDDDDDEVRLIETSFEEEKDEEVAYVRVDRIKSTNHRYGDSASDSGISEERTVISTSDSRNKSPISDCVDDKKGLSYSSLSGSTYELIQQEILLAETRQPTRERYEYVPPRAFARNKNDKELNGCFYLMACLDAFGVL